MSRLKPRPTKIICEAAPSNSNGIETLRLTDGGEFWRDTQQKDSGADAEFRKVL